MSTSEQSERRRPHNAPPGTDYWAARERLREERIVVKTEGTTTVAYQDTALVLKESADAFTQAVAPQEQLAAAAQRRLQGLSSRSGAPGTCCLHLLPGSPCHFQRVQTPTERASRAEPPSHNTHCHADEVIAPQSQSAAPYPRAPFREPVSRDGLPSYDPKRAY
ncbi:hypothetical protein ACFXOL_24380 [Streptomyces californicus]|uniref:hypothetical protein n=1 Tax=Streptomyces californicus TaxID=67351 RepID=UPI00364AB2D3